MPFVVRLDHRARSVATIISSHFMLNRDTGVAPRRIARATVHAIRQAVISIFCHPFSGHWWDHQKVHAWVKGPR
jgi:hypothetical protein